MRRGIACMLVLILAIGSVGCGVSIKPAPAGSSGEASSTSESNVAIPSITASPDPATTIVDDATPKTTPAAKADRAAKPSPTSTPAPATAAGHPSEAATSAAKPPATSTAAPAPDPEQANSQAGHLPASGSGQPNSVPTPTPTPPSQSTAPPAAPQPTPTATTTTTTPGLPSCQTEPVRGFGLAWHDYPALANAIGCPLGPEIGLPSMVQAYQHGLMIWLDLQANASTIDSQSWVVALGGTTANRTRIDDSGLTWQLGQVTPSGAFAWVYQNVYTDADRLGAPSTPLSQSDAAIELFEHGTMIWLRNPPGSSTSQPMIYIIQTNLVTGASGSFQAVPDKSFQ